MNITEPTTMLTDYILALMTLFLAGKLVSINQSNRQASIQLWIFALLGTALAAIFGGTSHGFALYLSDFVKGLLWKATVYTIGFAAFFMVAGTIISSVTNPLRRWLLALVTLQLFVYAIWMIGHNDFKYVIYDYVPGMVGVMLLQAYSLVSKKAPSATWIISGILVSFMAAAVQQSGYTMHEYFNHNDLYHVIQMGAIYLLYRGVAVMRDYDKLPAHAGHTETVEFRRQ